MTRIMIALAAALMLVLPAPSAEASPASPATSVQLATVYFTDAETQFLGHMAGIDIHAPSDQIMVDAGWNVLYQLQHGSTPTNQAAFWFYNSHNEQGDNGVSLAQAQAAVRWAIHDLTGTSPSPGGNFSDPGTYNDSIA